MNFGLIVVGDEILSGRRQDKHLAKVIELLAARGQQLAWAYYAGDDRAQLTAVLKRAFAGGDTVFCCGGIGATPDDHTRQSAAAALELPLALHPQAESLILERMQDMGIAFDPSAADHRHRLNMGVFPVGAQIIPNPYNKIPGFSVADVHFVPGFPVMAHPMIEWVLAQRYADLPPRDWAEHALIVYGGLEATLTPLMEQIQAAYAGVLVFSLPSVDRPVHGRHIELGVKGPPGPARQAFDDLRAQLAKNPSIRLGTTSP
jgi:molybdopterin-biosynthesis enzyme MoeA-like protein